MAFWTNTLDQFYAFASSSLANGSSSSSCSDDNILYAPIINNPPKLIGPILITTMPSIHLLHLINMHDKNPSYTKYGVLTNSEICHDLSRFYFHLIQNMYERAAANTVNIESNTETSILMKLRSVAMKGKRQNSANQRRDSTGDLNDDDSWGDQEVSHDVNFDFEFTLLPSPRTRDELLSPSTETEDTYSYGNYDDPLYVSFRGTELMITQFKSVIRNLKDISFKLHHEIEHNMPTVPVSRRIDWSRVILLSIRSLTSVLDDYYNSEFKKLLQTKVVDCNAVATFADMVDETKDVITTIEAIHNFNVMNNHLQGNNGVGTGASSALSPKRSHRRRSTSEASQTSYTSIHQAPAMMSPTPGTPSGRSHRHSSSTSSGSSHTRSRHNSNYSSSGGDPDSVTAAAAAANEDNANFIETVSAGLTRAARRIKAHVISNTT